MDALLQKTKYAPNQCLIHFYCYKFAEHLVELFTFHIRLLSGRQEKCFQLVFPTHALVYCKLTHDVLVQL